MTYQKKCGLISGELAVDVFTYWRASVLGFGVRRIACLIYWSILLCHGRYTATINTQRIMTQTHTHVQGYSDRPGQAHLEKPLHRFIRCGLWCDGHSFEMPHVALIKITNKKGTTHPAQHRMTVFIVVLGGFLFPWFSLTIQPLNGIEMSLKENTNF